MLCRYAHVYLHARAHKCRVVKLGIGSVLIKNALNKEEQVWLAKYAMNLSKTDSNGGFYRSKNVLNATQSRGRIYKNLSEYPDQTKITNMCLDFVNMARQVAPKLPIMKPTHLLLLYYTSSTGLAWHRDSDPNDGDNDEPIVSISLGNSCVFGYKPFARPSIDLKINSSDILVWGGPERLLAHCVKNVVINSSPKYLHNIIGNARLNFTFRSAPNIIGLEQYYTSDIYYSPHIL